MGINMKPDKRITEADGLFRYDWYLEDKLICGADIAGLAQVSVADPYLQNIWDKKISACQQEKK